MDIVTQDWFFSLADGIVLNAQNQISHPTLYHFAKPESLYFTEFDWDNTKHPQILGIYGDIFESVLDRLTIFTDCKKVLVLNSGRIANEKVIIDWLNTNPNITLYIQNLTFSHPRAFVLPYGIKIDEKINFKKLFQNEKFADIFNTSLQYENYEEFLLYNSFCKFTLCPSQTNLDNQSIWEALAIGSIPVVQDSPFIRQLVRTIPDLPIQIVDSFSKVDVENFIYKFPNHNSFVSQGYWESKILGPPIVLVHLGKDIPEFVYDNIQQIRLWNPLNKIYFITNLQEFLFVSSRIEIIHTKEIPIAKQHFYFLKNSGLDDTYKFGFWRFSTERIFLLLALMEYKDLSHFIHFENDVMPYCTIEKDLQEYIGSNSVKKLVVSNMNSPGRNSLATFACNCKKSLEEFCTFLATKKYSNDMEAIWIFGQKNPELVSLFPSKPEDGNFILDSAFFGQFLGGPDPINHENPIGMLNPGYLNASADVNYKEYNYEWKRELNGLWRFYVNGKKVYTLHIHCKSLTFFQSDKPIMLPIPIPNMKDLNLGLRKDLSKQYGFFIEVGSGDGIYKNKTILLEKKLNWKGILIEPNIEDVNKCKIIRNNCKVIHCACVSRDYTKDTIFGDFTKKSLGSVNGLFTNSTDLIEVPAKTLDTILKETIEPNEKIDLLCITVNHYELNVLYGINLSYYRPRYIIISIFKTLYKDILQHLFENKYSLIGRVLHINEGEKFDPFNITCLFKDNT